MSPSTVRGPTARAIPGRAPASASHSAPSRPAPAAGQGPARPGPSALRSRTSGQARPGAAGAGDRGLPGRVQPVRLGALPPVTTVLELVDVEVDALALAGSFVTSALA